MFVYTVIFEIQGYSYIQWFLIRDLYVYCTDTLGGVLRLARNVLCHGVLNIDYRAVHYNDVIMTTMASQITSLMVVYSTVYSDADQRKHQSSATLAFAWGIHRGRWIPRTKGQLRGKCFHLMTSSWIYYIIQTKIANMIYNNSLCCYIVTYVCECMCVICVMCVNHTHTYVCRVYVCDLGVSVIFMHTRTNTHTYVTNMSKEYTLVLFDTEPQKTVTQFHEMHSPECNWVTPGSLFTKR